MSFKERKDRIEKTVEEIIYINGVTIDETISYDPSRFLVYDIFLKNKKILEVKIEENEELICKCKCDIKCDMKEFKKFDPLLIDFVRKMNIICSDWYEDTEEFIEEYDL